jgi:hypothetical protein
VPNKYIPVESDCLHDWIPIQGCCARYECTKCQALGYKDVVLGTSIRKSARALSKNPPGTIIPYCCEFPGCHQPAVISVSSVYGVKLCCDEHKSERSQEFIKRHSRAWFNQEPVVMAIGLIW